MFSLNFSSLQLLKNIRADETSLMLTLYDLRQNAIQRGSMLYKIYISDFL